MTTLTTKTPRTGRKPAERSQEDIDYVLTNYPDLTIKIQAMVDHLGCNVETVHKIARRLGLGPRPATNGNRINPEVVDRIIALKREGYAHAEIAEEVGVNPDTVTRYAGHIKFEQAGEKSRRATAEAAAFYSLAAYLSAREKVRKIATGHPDLGPAMREADRAREEATRSLLAWCRGEGGGSAWLDNGDRSWRVNPAGDLISKL